MVRGLELMVALVNEQVHESVISIDHPLDVVEVPLLKELHLLSIALRKHANLLLDRLFLTSTLEEDRLGVRADLGLHNVLYNELTHKLHRLLFGHTKFVTLIKWQGLEVLLVLNDVDLQADLFDPLLESILELLVLELVHLLEDFDLADMAEGFLPVRLVELASREHNVVSTVLRQELDAFLIVLVDQLSEVLADHILLDRELVRADVGDLQEHGGGHVDTVKCFQVDVQVWRHVPFPLLLLVFGR